MIHEYFVDIFVHGKLFDESAKRTNGTICHVQKCQQNTSESMSLLSTKTDNQFPMSIITFVFLSFFYICLDVFCFMADLGINAIAINENRSIPFLKRWFFFHFSLIWNKNCSKCNSKTFHDLNLPQPSHPSTWLCRIEISEKKSLCIGLHKNGNILHRFYSSYSTATRKKWTMGCAVFLRNTFLCVKDK